MTLFRSFLCSVLVFAFTGFSAQEVLNKTLLRADKHYIRKEYPLAVLDYVKYLQTFPRDFYASRQAARCYDKLNDPYNAIDYWPLVVESSEATEEDYLDFAKCLLANNRGPEAKRIFSFLSKSKNPTVSAWGKTYIQPSFAAQDTSLVKLHELVNVNTSQSENCPVFFRDKLFFVLNSLPGAMDYKAEDAIASQSLKVYIPKDSLEFMASLLFDKLQALNLRGQVSFSKDGKSMFFTRVLNNKEMGIKSKPPFFKHQLFVVNLTTLNTPFPEISEFEHNVHEYNTMHPGISEDGKRLYFSSDRKGSVGGMDIFVCTKTGLGWSLPVNLGLHVNTNGNEVFPHVGGDTLLYFSSDQRPGLGGLDVFVAGLSGDEKSVDVPAKNCGAPFNSRFDDFGVFVLKGGKKGYLSSKRKNNTDEDLYYFISKE
jgi:peptidoglycan-associated lipoprotein